MRKTTKKQDSSTPPWYSVNVKPFSANQMWYGQKVDTAAYRKYKDHLKEAIPDLIIPKGKLLAQLLVAHSSSLFDLDNAFKPLFDALQKVQTSFNDRDIYEIRAKKIIVPRGKESLNFRLKPIEE